MIFLLVLAKFPWPLKNCFVSLYKYFIRNYCSYKSWNKTFPIFYFLFLFLYHSRIVFINYKYIISFLYFEKKNQIRNKPKIIFVIYTFLVCPFVTNKRQNGWTDRAQILCRTSRDPREGLWMIKISKICL